MKRRIFITVIILVSFLGCIRDRDLGKIHKVKSIKGEVVVKLSDKNYHFKKCTVRENRTKSGDYIISHSPSNSNDFFILIPQQCIYQVCNQVSEKEPMASFMLPEGIFTSKSQEVKVVVTEMNDNNISGNIYGTFYKYPDIKDTVYMEVQFCASK